MKREDRYIVIKRKDFDNFLTVEEQGDVANALTMIDSMRTQEGRKGLEALVIEKDWPEYEPTLKALEERVTMETWQAKVQKRDYMLEYARGMDEAGAALQGEGKVAWVKGVSPYCNGWNDFVKKWLAV